MHTPVINTPAPTPMNPYWFNMPTDFDISTDTSSAQSSPMNSYLTPKLVVDLVPKFDGRSTSLTKFIKQAKLADSGVKPADRLNLLSLIRNKITGHADMLISHTREPQNLDELIKLLQKSFVRTFDVDTAHAELSSKRQERDETADAFGARISESLGRALDAVEYRFGASQLLGVCRIFISVNK